MRNFVCASAALFALGIGVAGCKGEEICAGGLVGAEDAPVATCKLESATEYKVVLQASGFADTPDRESEGPDEPLFDDWNASVEGLIREPDGDERTFEGAARSATAVTESQGPGGESVTLTIHEYIPGETGMHELVIRKVEFGERAPRDKIEVAVRTD